MTTYTASELQDIQGAAIGRFRKDHQDLLFVRFGSQASTRTLLGKLAKRVASAWEVRRFNELFSEISRRTGEGVIEATWVAVGISASGYAKLGVDVGELGSSEGVNAFRAGMAARSADQIGDPPEDQPVNWLDPFKPGAGVDAIIIIASDSRDDLDEATDRLTAEIADSGGEIVFRERGATLPGALRGREHFGFKDGVSQPAIDGIDPLPANGEPAALPLGEFVLGYPNNSGTAAPVGSLWHGGTIAVFRRLHQSVAAFRAQATAMSSQTSPTLTADHVATDLVGRWPSGAPLAHSPDSDPGRSSGDNAFDFSDDPDGQHTPRFSHIRKVNPRAESRPDATGDPTQNHRMIRAGIPYGDPLPLDATADDGAERGLHFLAFVTDPDRQFEFIQRQWANNPNFPNGGAPQQQGGPYTPPQPGTLADGVDPIIGAHNAGDAVAFNQGGSIHSLSLLADTVRVTAGEYFFCPSVSALHALGGGATSSTPAAAVAPSAPPATAA